MSQNLIKRIITSIILLFLFFIISFSNKYIFVFSICLVGFIICIEANKIFLKLLEIKPYQVSYKITKFNLKFLILNLITFFYIFFIFCYFSYQLYLIQTPIFFLYLVFICFFTDIGGYICGKIIGGKKLTTISPNKTISGTIGSFIFSIVPLILFSNLNYLKLEFDINNLIFCLIVSLISQIGDLFISYLKRKANIKDTGKILPGHGGILDRVDGIIFALPFSYLLIKFI
jgi:phosphatidate cytidylyltransferase|tara:strand:+ start:702 stop:1391 length:690 start_codon:yes stop_codon:yes gene_type:complete